MFKYLPLICFLFTDENLLLCVELSLNYPFKDKTSESRADLYLKTHVHKCVLFHLLQDIVDLEENIKALSVVKANYTTLPQCSVIAYLSSRDSKIE